MWERYKNGSFNHESKSWQLAGRDKGAKICRWYGLDVDERTFQEKALKDGLVFSEGKGTNTYTQFMGDSFLEKLLESREV